MAELGLKRSNIVDLTQIENSLNLIIGAFVCSSLCGDAQAENFPTLTSFVHGSCCHLAGYGSVRENLMMRRPVSAGV